MSARNWLVVLGLILIGSMSPFVQAQDTWILGTGPGTTGNWFTGSNWSGEVPPTVEDNAVVDNGTIAVISGSGTPATAATVFIGATTLGSTVQLAGTNLNANVVIGPQGTLRFSGGFQTGTIQDDGLILIDLPGVNTLDSVSGAGRIIIAPGVLPLILDGPNTFTGVTTVSAGASLQFGTGETNGTIGGDIVNNGAVSFFEPDPFTFGGVISGTGSVEQVGPGTIILTGDNTYTGGTTIDEGRMLQLGNGGASGSITGNVVDNGILAFDRSDVSTFGGVISGPGSVQQIGSGTTVLTGNNTYSGGTTINAGTLQLGNGGPTGSITGNVIDNGVLAVNRSNTYTLTGVISGSGSFEQNGSGTTILTRDNTYSGTTTVNAGSLIVDGSIASVQTLVNPDGLFGGTGFVGNLVNSGIVSPGDTPGTLHVSGDYTQNASGTLRIEVAGTASGQFDVLAVGGHASLGGTLQLIRLGAFQLQVGDKLTFLTAQGGVSGAFRTIQNPFLSNTIIKAQIIVLPNAVQLIGTQGSFTEAACNPNSLAVAKALDSVVGDPRAAELISFLNTQPLNQLCGDFQLIAPEELTSMYNIGFSVENVQSDNLNRRMNNVHAGSTGFSAAGFTINGVTPSYSSGLSGPTGAEGKTGPSVLAPVPENRWGVFATGLGEFTHVDGTDGASGFDLQTGGVTVGVDYRIGSNFAVGLLAGYAHTNADLVNDGNLDVNSAKFGLYATAFTGGFYLNSAVTGGWSEYDSRRTALLGTANGSTDGGDINVLVSTGYDWRKGNLSIGPTASFQYNYLSFNGFTESGSLAPLKFNDQHSDSIRTAFGMKASYDWKVGNVLVRPELRAAWQHEYGLSAYPIAASFASGAGSSFTVSGPKIGRDSFLLGAGVAILWTDRIATYIYYDGELGRTNYDSHNISGGIRVTF
jgi:outer membrane autotransporter protein